MIMGALGLVAWFVMGLAQAQGALEISEHLFNPETLLAITALLYLGQK